MNTDLVIGFMERMNAVSSQNVFVILDNLNAHHSNLMRAWLAERKNQIEVFCLLPYSFEINPDEDPDRDCKTEKRFSGSTIRERRC